MSKERQGLKFSSTEIWRPWTVKQPPKNAIQNSSKLNNFLTDKNYDNEKFSFPKEKQSRCLEIASDWNSELRNSFQNYVLKY